VEEEWRRLASSGTATCCKASPKDLQAKIIEFVVKRENQGYKSTRKLVYTLSHLQRLGADLRDPESVKKVLAHAPFEAATKNVYACAYEAFLKFLGGQWERPKYECTRKIPFIPLETELDQLIAALSPTLAVFCQILKETGARAGEVVKLKWTDVDFERRLIRINNPEKGSNPRIIKVSEKCINMINRLPRKKETIFKNLNTINSSFNLQRKRIAAKLNNPRILKISFHTFRHWRATMEYHKTKDILYVKELLGHKDIKNTMIYITIEKTLFKESNDEFTVKVASSLEEFVKLLEVGFEYVGDYEGKKVLRKRK